MTQISDIPSGRTARFQTAGVAIIEDVLSGDDLAAMDVAFPILPQKVAGARASDFTPDAVNWLTCHEGLLELAGLLAHAPVRVCRVLAFDKSSGINWFVPWHQDRAEDGRDRPVVQLERMVALRVHLDDCDEDNGPLEVVPGSHTQGRLESREMAAVTGGSATLICLAARGDIVALRPLLVHRSQRARLPRARRVLHIEYQPVH